MKMMKLFAATALAVGTVTGALVESAEARSGNGFSRKGGGEDTVQEVDQTYILFKRDPQENLIQDSDESDLSGLFEGAVEDFFNYSPPINQDDDNEFVDPIFGSLGFTITESGDRRFIGFDGVREPASSPAPVNLANLEATLFQGIDDIVEQLENDLSEDISVSNDFDDKFNIEDLEDLQVVGYRILDPQDSTSDLLDQTAYLFINSDVLRGVSDVLQGEFNTFTEDGEPITIQGGAENVPGGSNFPFPSLVEENSGQFANLATNDLGYIFDNNLFGLALGSETAADLLEDPGILDDLNSFISITPDVYILDAIFEEEVVVPEPGTATTLVALGVLGVGLGLKRKLK